VHLAIAVTQALRAIRKHQPRVVLGAGGFASGPGGIAAWLSRKPLVVHEQNAVGRPDQSRAGALATRVLEGFPGSFGKRVHSAACRQSRAARHRRDRCAERAIAGREGQPACSSSAAARALRALNAVLPAALE
jgi:UDP-N-acetylglucosamine--N-acetylmuramyl-(pentapeptide) pyrophosphoryl-undecaprenol N-acetylglucosamine transferase